MSIITTCKIKNIFSNLENNIKKLKSVNDLLTFQVIIYESIELLSLISKKNKKMKINRMRKKFQ
jgi:hypothetical protein